MPGGEQLFRLFRRSPEGALDAEVHLRRIDLHEPYARAVGERDRVAVRAATRIGSQRVGPQETGRDLLGDIAAGRPGELLDDHLAVTRAGRRDWRCGRSD